MSHTCASSVRLSDSFDIKQLSLSMLRNCELLILCFCLLTRLCLSADVFGCDVEYYLSEKKDIVEQNKYACPNMTASWKSLIHGDSLLYPDDPDLLQMFPHNPLINIGDMHHKNILMVSFCNFLFKYHS